MQQVNLYQPILRKQEKVFSAKTMLQGNLLVLLGLILLFSYTAVQTRNMQTQLTQVRQQHDEQIKKLATLTAQYPPKTKDNSIKGRIEQAQAQLLHERKLLVAVEQLGLDGESGFFEHLTGLARQDLPQLWLQRIYLQNGNQVDLTGSAHQAEAVALYLQRLTEEKPFNGTAFQSVVIARHEEQPGQVNFTLSTEPPQAEVAQ